MSQGQASPGSVPGKHGRTFPTPNPYPGCLSGLRVHSESALVAFHASAFRTFEDQCLSSSGPPHPQHTAILHGSPRLLSLGPSLSTLALV